jgi:hypothetical protein
MAAPSTAYLNNGNAIRMDEEDLAAAIINSYDALIAAYIYGAADIKALFYLDAIVEVEITDDAATVIGTGFIGLVIVNGANYKYHAAARRFKGSLTSFTDVEVLVNAYIALNDGGLNTLGHSNQPSAATTTDLRAKLASIFFKTAYYEPSTEFGIIVKQTAATPTLADPYFILRTNQPQNADYTLTNVNIGNLTCWVTLYVYSVNKNLEGVRIDLNARTIYVNGDAITLAYQTTKPLNSGEVTGIDTTYFTDGDTTNGFPGGRISTNSGGFTAPTNGFYVSRTKELWYQVTSGFIVDEGVYSSLPPGTSEYKYYELANFACGESVISIRALYLSTAPSITTGSIAPDGLGDGIYRTTSTANTGTIFTVYQSLECPDGGLSCADADKIILYRIGSVTNC